MDKTYNSHQIEQHWQEQYLKQEIGKPSGNGEKFSIVIPPPNITGILHMGHGFQLTLMDTIVRHQRMLGKNVLWQMGTDHAGIATQMVVEKQCVSDGTTKEELGREAFIAKITKWQQQSGGKIKQQIIRMGASVDWSSEKFTLDPDLSEAVTKVFVDLYREESIYQGNKLVNWDPELKTAISDLEVVNETVQGSLWHIKYPITDSNEHLVIATTRPETMFGDTAVAVNPDDERYQKYIGKTITLPFSNAVIPIIADEHVDIAFGTGCVKVTPAHDFNDYAIGMRHNLAIKNILNNDASLNENVPAEFQNLDRFEARKLVVTQLTANKLLIKTEPHTMVVPKGDRSGSIIEPYLTPQWFMKTAAVAAPAIDAVKDSSIKFHPQNWENTYFSWLENIQDWCLSRQLWWGHRIPAWYDENHNVYVGYTEQEAREHYNISSTTKLTQDNDVLDTWFSSALWPFSTLGWPQDTQRMLDFFPTNLLITGFDIIFFWVARMIMMSLKLTTKIPFEDVYITGLIRDSQGQKMSKSKGNILDPIDLIDGISYEDLITKRTYGLMQPKMREQIVKATKKEFSEGIEANGADALRFTFAAIATPGRDIKFDTSRLVGYRNFCNKLWNCARYVSMNVASQPQQPKIIKHPINLWCSSLLSEAIVSANNHLKNYRFDLFTNTIYELLWHNYCDWYLELSKTMLKSDDTELANETRYVLINALETILRLAHPLIPFITEEIWQSIEGLTANKPGLLTQQLYPKQESWIYDDNAINEIKLLQEVIIAIRTTKAEMNIAPGHKIKLIVSKYDAASKQTITQYADFISSLAKVTEISWHDDASALTNSATAILKTCQLNIPLDGLIDKDAEITRLEKSILKIEKSLAATTARLANKQYLTNAPEHIVLKERGAAKEWQESLAKLQAQKHAILGT
jgi:valyl-tRNA synthetase